jgi:co-chaperonin GroES (HSP10)
MNVRPLRDRILVKRVEEQEQRIGGIIIPDTAKTLRKAAGLRTVRFHDGRHTALTRLAEKGQADWVIQAQMGHVSPMMMKTYSHIRRKALDEAALALEPSFTLKFPKHAGVRSRKGGRAATSQPTSQFTSQSGKLQEEASEFPKGIGSPHWTISATGCPRSGINGLLLTGSPRFREVSL